MQNVYSDPDDNNEPGPQRLWQALDDAIGEGDGGAVAQILRELDSVECDSWEFPAITRLADTIDPKVEPDWVFPYKLILQKRVSGRPASVCADPFESLQPEIECKLLVALHDGDELGLAKLLRTQTLIQDSLLKILAAHFDDGPEAQQFPMRMVFRSKGPGRPRRTFRERTDLWTIGLTISKYCETMPHKVAIDKIQTELKSNFGHTISRSKAEYALSLVRKGKRQRRKKF